LDAGAKGTDSARLANSTLTLGGSTRADNTSWNGKRPGEVGELGEGALKTLRLIPKPSF
jgi:hypothetical protein